MPSTDLEWGGRSLSSFVSNTEMQPTATTARSVKRSGFLSQVALFQSKERNCSLGLCCGFFGSAGSLALWRCSLFSLPGMWLVPLAVHGACPHVGLGARSPLARRVPGGGCRPALGPGARAAVTSLPLTPPFVLPQVLMLTRRTQFGSPRYTAPRRLAMRWVPPAPCMGVVGADGRRGLRFSSFPS